MSKVDNINIEQLPRTGYLTSKEEKREKFYANEPHIHKQDLFTGLRVTLHKLENDIFTYFPKGFSGSKNSDFYEYLSLGMVPYLIGSGMMYALYKSANNAFKLTDKTMANSVATKMGAGILFYGLGKMCSRKLSHSLIHASTGVNLDMKYLNRVNELPEPGQDKGLERVQYPGVFDSVTFYRCDLLDKDSEINHENVYWYYDKVAKRAGYNKPLNNPNQEMGPKLKQLKARTTALENISKYIVAATGVALGSRNAFGELNFAKVFSKTNKFNYKAILGNLQGFKDAFLKAGKQLWKGSNQNLITKNYGKALVLGSLISTLLTWLVPTIGFKTHASTMNSKVDTTKEYEVC